LAGARPGGRDLRRATGRRSDVARADREDTIMPDKKTIERARRDERERKSPSTQAGEFVREEIEHVREGKHGARSSRQAIAIGLSKARRAGVDLPPPDAETTSKATRAKAKRDTSAGDERAHKASAKRSHATHEALEREGHAAGSHRALSRQARKSAAKRSAAERSAAARKAARTKGAAGRSAAAKKAARTRARRAAS
jgi:hypothetical protein